MSKKRIILFLACALCFAPLMNGVFFASPAQAGEIPDWVSNTKLIGDFRFRYQNEDNVYSKVDKTDEMDRERWRIRLRFGLETAPNDQWTVGFGIASGSDDPRSTNQTMENFFETPDARLDYAYTTWKPMENIALTAGKFKNPIWNPKDLLWDSDIMPNGLTGNFNIKASDTFKFFITPSFFILDEYKDEALDDEDEPTVNHPEDDPSMVALQAGTKMDFNKTVGATLGVTYYKFNNTQDVAFFQGEEDASSWSVEAEAGIESLPVYIGIIGQYVVSDADDDETGYLVGAVCGDKKIKDLWDWQVKYSFRRLEEYAWWDQLPDADFLGGDTGLKGSKVELAMGLHKNVNIGINYVTSEYLVGNKDQDIVQVDLNVKFP
ncbi:MAG: hypothetical protein FP816_09865 [Desulfobacteraceae bacterium]|nr:hypothetical protein [Desulfobacteraceae bacterium]